MRSGASWEIRLDQPQVLAIALHLRDVAGIAQQALPSDLPAAEPRVAPDDALRGRPQLAEQWNAWWSRALATGPEALGELRPPYAAFDGAPALQDVLRSHLDPARRWSSGPRLDGAGTRGHDAPPLGKLVADVERRAGRAARPFLLRLDEVPVAGRGLWRVGDEHLLLSSALVRDHEALAARLRPELEQLV